MFSFLVLRALPPPPSTGLAIDRNAVILELIFASCSDSVPVTSPQLPADEALQRRVALVHERASSTATEC